MTGFRNDDKNRDQHKRWLKKYEGCGSYTLNLNLIRTSESEYLVEKSESDFHLNLKKEIRSWVNDCKKNQSGRLEDLRSKLCHIDKVIDQGGVNDDILLTRLDLLKKLHDIKSSDARDYMQKAKIQWAIKGDENSNFFHGIINRKRANLAIKGVMVNGEWVDDPCRVKE
ncbi:hypothetical protein Tco_1422446 [Tanacetum coccineum]